jgi:carbon monoxide dehydrogenase subunit G
VAGSPYVFEHDKSFTFDASRKEVWAVLERFDGLAAGWPWLHELHIEGPGLETGTVMSGVVAPPVPYRMRLRVVIDECRPEQSLIASVHGDLEGVAHMTFDGDGDETRVHAMWTIEMKQPPMRVAARVAPRLLRWGHDRVVDATVNGLRRHLADDSG